MSAAEDRAAFVAALRAIADLVESDESVERPTGVTVHFWARGEGDNAAQAAKIATTLPPASWKGAVHHWGTTDYLEMKAQYSPGLDVSIAAPVAAVATEAGTKTVTVWEPRPEIAALLSEPMRDQA